MGRNRNPNKKSHAEVQAAYRARKRARDGVKKDKADHAAESRKSRKTVWDFADEEKKEKIRAQTRVRGEKFRNKGPDNGDDPEAADGPQDPAPPAAPAVDALPANPDEELQVRANIKNYRY